MEKIHEIPYQEVLDSLSHEEKESLIENNAHPGFKEDYNVLQAILMVIKPTSVFEVGTNIGTGTDIICRTLPNALVYSLDLDYESMMKNPSEFPVDANGSDRVGTTCTRPYIQLRGDSRSFDYSKYPCELYFVDAEHTKEAVTAETFGIIMMAHPRVIVYHDTDIPEVMAGIIEGLQKALRSVREEGAGNLNYRLSRITGTRIAYLVNL